MCVYVSRAPNYIIIKSGGGESIREEGVKKKKKKKNIREIYIIHIYNV